MKLKEFVLLLLPYGIVQLLDRRKSSRVLTEAAMRTASELAKQTADIKKMLHPKEQRYGSMLKFRTVQDTVTLIRKNLHTLPSDIDVVVGIPRSGVFPADLIALFLNKPFMTITEFAAHLPPYHGSTRAVTVGSFRKVLVVDDSVSSGKQLREAKEYLAGKAGAGVRFEYLCVYATAQAAKSGVADYCFEIVDHPRLFEWNYLNHAFCAISCYDFDGVLCVDPDEKQNDDGERYRDFLLNARPLYIPQAPINTIVTSRLEKYRPQTEQWLKVHHVSYGRLVMLDLPNAQERRKLGVHARFKAEIFEKSDCLYFVESDPAQAREIALLSKKPVICAQTDEFYRVPFDLELKAGGRVLPETGCAAQ